MESPCPNCGYCPHCGRGGHGGPITPRRGPYRSPIWNSIDSSGNSQDFDLVEDSIDRVSADTLEV